jgi:SagB-type dehydrogenase family enzyme
LDDAPGPPYADLYRPQAIAACALTSTHVANLLQLAFGLSAWKQYGDQRWALRCNPSSGNLHPTEAYVVLAGCAGIEDGVHHYASRDHVLEHRCRWHLPAGGAPLPPHTLLVGLSSIHWREAWKYGERAFRYCQHDVGHAIAAVRYAAATLGWHARLLTACSDAQIGELLGLDRDTDVGTAEREHPDALLWLTPGEPVPVDTSAVVQACLRATRTGRWQGRANRLSTHHVHDWPVIDEVALACTQPEIPASAWHAPTLPDPLTSACGQGAIAVIQQRRSAQALDGATSLAAPAFYRMLDVTLPRPLSAPWDALTWAPRVHLLLFVHRVDGLVPGLYLLLRDADTETRMRAALSTEFDWRRVQGSPGHLRFYRLVAGDARNAARTLSCHQDIAADGAFSLAMLADYAGSLRQAPWVYRRLFWEAGMLGQVLYLEAEAAGARGTGIGCYFDDAVHELLGIETDEFQSVYHFTVGYPVVDDRLQTLPAYAHLTRV